MARSQHKGMRMQTTLLQDKLHSVRHESHNGHMAVASRRMLKASPWTERGNQEAGHGVWGPGQWDEVQPKRPGRVLGHRQRRRLMSTRLVTQWRRLGRAVE